MLRSGLSFFSCLAAVVLFSSAPSATAPAVPANDCNFVTSGLTTTLQGDCATDSSIFIIDGETMDLGGHTIVAVDPPGGHFVGAVVTNAGAWAGLQNGTISTSQLANVCDAGASRLRGVMLEGASGFVNDLSVDSINQGASGCQEGNAIEIRNGPFDGTHPATVTVEVGANVIVNWQKTGIVANGDVDVWIHHNVVAESATQANLAANSIQVGFGAKALVEHNHIAGNSWPGASDYAATSVLLYLAETGTVVRRNVMMDGNADIGIYVFSDGVTVDNNKIFESGPDLNQNGYDIALGDWGISNVITNNKAKGYATGYDNVVDGRNKEIPSPSKQ